MTKAHALLLAAALGSATTLAAPKADALLLQRLWDQARSGLTRVAGTAAGVVNAVGSGLQQAASAVTSAGGRLIHAIPDALEAIKNRAQSLIHQHVRPFIGQIAERLRPLVNQALQELRSQLGQLITQRNVARILEAAIGWGLNRLRPVVTPWLSTAAAAAVQAAITALTSGGGAALGPAVMSGLRPLLGRAIDWLLGKAIDAIKEPLANALAGWATPHIRRYFGFTQRLRRLPLRYALAAR